MLHNLHLPSIFTIGFLAVVDVLGATGVACWQCLPVDNLLLPIDPPRTGLRADLRSFSAISTYRQLMTSTGNTNSRNVDACTHKHGSRYLQWLTKRGKTKVLYGPFHVTHCAALISL